MSAARWIAPLVLAAVVLGAASCGDDDGGDAASRSPEAEEGRQIARRAGCTSCHGPDGEGGIGPPWTGIVGTEVELTDGTTVTVDREYLTRSIQEPRAQVHAGYDVAMPDNQLSDEEIAMVVEYIESLSEPAGTEASG